MPTRLVLKQTKTGSPSRGINSDIPPRVTSRLSDALGRPPSPSRPHSPVATPRPPLTSSTALHSSFAVSKRQLPTFRSSILRELNVRNSNNHGMVDADEELRMLAAARDDIRASPRLLGYLFSMIAGAVMLVSVVQFYRQRTFPPDVDPNASPEDIWDPDKYFFFLNGTVYRWKLWGAMYMSATGVALSLLSVGVHYDTVVAPKLWITLFRDGSLAERNWILFLVSFWATAVHLCTSALSVGEFQANVYFATWIAFGATALNFGVWRESAGLPALLEQVTALGSRETTYNWLWTALFSTIFAGATTNMFLNRTQLTLRFQGEPLDLVLRDWIITLSVVWCEVGLCLLAIVLNESLSQNQSWRLPCVVRSSDNGRYRCVLGWHQMEGLVIFLATGCKFWVVLEYAAVDGVIPGLSNAYIGLWASFFNSVFLLGTWLRENKNTVYLVRDEVNGD